jgi:hypothetical protein
MMMISGTAADIGGEVDISVRDNSTDLNGRQLIANARGNPVMTLCFATASTDYSIGRQRKMLLRPCL